MNRKICVSSAYADLRRAQHKLNRFVWSTSVSYGFTLASVELQGKSNLFIDDVLAETETPAWHPPSIDPSIAAQGESKAPSVKYRHLVRDFLSDVERNTHYVYLNAIVGFFTAFEVYLDSRCKGARFGNEKRWGPYYRSLSGESVYWLAGEAGRRHRQPVQLKTVLIADLVRLLRNKIAHAPDNVSAELSSVQVDRMLEDLAKTRWNQRLREANLDQWRLETENTIRRAIRSFEGAAQHKVARALEEHRLELPIEYFYMLFASRALNSMSFELEEALIEDRSETDAVVLIDDNHVRRPDLWT